MGIFGKKWANIGRILVKKSPVYENSESSSCLQQLQGTEVQHTTAGKFPFTYIDT